jgi:hypothetical protein
MFEPNNEQLWANIRFTINDILFVRGRAERRPSEA